MKLNPNFAGFLVSVTHRPVSTHANKPKLQDPVQAVQFLCDANLRAQTTKKLKVQFNRNYARDLATLPGCRQFNC